MFGKSTTSSGYIVIYYVIVLSLSFFLSLSLFLSPPLSLSQQSLILFNSPELYRVFSFAVIGSYDTVLCCYKEQLDFSL